MGIKGQPGGAYQPAPNTRNEGIKSGNPDPDGLPSDHPGSKAPVLPGQAQVGAPVK